MGRDGVAMVLVGEPGSSGEPAVQVELTGVWSSQDEAALARGAEEAVAQALAGVAEEEDGDDPCQTAERALRRYLRRRDAGRPYVVARSRR